MPIVERSIYLGKRYLLNHYKDEFGILVYHVVIECPGDNMNMGSEDL